MRSKQGLMIGTEIHAQKEREMRRKIGVLVVVAALVMGVSVFSAPSASQANPFTVTEITYTIVNPSGSTFVWCAGIAGSCPAGSIVLATLPGTGITLTASQTIV